jgi:hypothetical protein
VTMEYKAGASAFHSLYPEDRPGGESWGRSELGDDAKWWSKDPLKQAEYGNGLGILAGNTFIQIGTSFPEKTPILDQPQARYEDLGPSAPTHPSAPVTIFPATVRMFPLMTTGAPRGPHGVRTVSSSSPLMDVS